MFKTNMLKLRFPTLMKNDLNNHSHAARNEISEFNHNWLQNVFINRVGAFVSRLSLDELPLSAIHRFYPGQFLEWEAKRNELLILLRSYEFENSNRMLFAAGLLSECTPEVRNWLLDVVRTSWSARYRVSARIEELNLLVRAVDEEWLRLRELSFAPNCVDLELLVGNLARFEEFHARCRTLAASLSELLKDTGSELR